MSEHLDVDALADHLAGEGDGGPHLSSCAACTARLAELAAAEVTVAASLAGLPAPAMPPGLADRINAALIAAAPAAPAATVTPLADQRRARHAWLPSVAAGVVLLGGAGLGYALVTGGDGQVTGGDGTLATLDGAREPDTGLVGNASGLDYADAAAVATGLAKVLAGTATHGELTAGASRNKAGAVSPTAQSQHDSAADSAADPLARLRDPAGLASCLLALLPPDQPQLRPLALDYARYDGAPALAVVLPDPDPTKVSVFVVGPGCSQANDSTVFFTRLDRP